MKKIKNQFLRFFSWLIGTVILSCNCDTVEMYGVPSANYKINGMVTYQGTPVENIQVKAFSTEYDNFTFDDTTTDTSGTYSLNFDGDLLSTLTIQVGDASDDSSIYNIWTQEVSFTESDYKDKGKDGWYKGTSKKTVNAELTKKK